MGLTYAISIVKWFFSVMLVCNFLFFAKFELLMFHNNIVKLSEKKMNKRNLLQICPKLATLQISA